jgi:hypothetical protein
MKRSSEFVLREERHRTALVEFIMRLDLKRAWTIAVKPYTKARTNDQLALYWKWLAIVANETGNDSDDLHEVFKKKFLAPKSITLGDEQHLRWTTVGLSTAEMSQYIDAVSGFIVAELGIFLPHPSDQHDRRST